MKFNYLLFIIFISSCNSNLDRYSTSVVTTDTALSVVNSNETKGNCRESANLNTENLKLGSVKNLQSYNGIKNFKFELAKNTFVDCLECTTIGNGLDSCKIKNSLNFLDKEWTGDVYFINDSLSRIEVQLSNTDLTDVYFRLKTIFGIPNVQNHKVVRSKNSIRNIKVSGNHKRDYRPYSESINDYLSAFNGNSNDDENFTHLSLDDL